MADAAQWSDLVCLLLPDQVHRAVYESEIEPVLGNGDLLLVAHGFSVHFEEIRPGRGMDVALVAPVGPGSTLRRLYVEGYGIPALCAVSQDVTGTAWGTALRYAGALGSGRAGILRSTFREEVETDLFGEQAVLCGGLTALMKAGFGTLVDAGYQPEVAFFECVHQVKLIVDLVYERGFSGMHAAISDTAEYGDYLSGPRVVGEASREAMKTVLRDIQDGTFARSWIEEVRSGGSLLLSRRAEERDSQVEEVGDRLRAMMPWFGSRGG
jgi:ketol-acid reductoisomerase